jgi:transcriptional antiterminator NusG
MKDHEVERLLADVERKEMAPQIRVGFKRGDSVRVKEGPFENFDGYVEDINPAKGLVKVIVTIFGRATSIELEYWLVEPV